MHCALQDSDFPDAPEQAFACLRKLRLDCLPMPAGGQTLLRWRALAMVGAHDLGLGKLYESHVDALAILSELEPSRAMACGAWAVWAAEAPGARLRATPNADGGLRLSGRKAWCSGARCVDHALLTAWLDDAHSILVAVDLRQPGITLTEEGWFAVGMASVPSGDIVFDNVHGRAVGKPGAYLARPGFWQGGAGVAALWYGASVAIAEALHVRALPAARPDAHRLAHLGAIDLHLQTTRALMREAARDIDAHPQHDAFASATRVRAACEQTASRVLEHAGRALGAAPFCRDAAFARRSADLSVFIRQTHAERDLAALGSAVPRETCNWML